jgi:glutamine amidotransferase
MKTVIIDYGAGNVFSVRTALERLGCTATVTCDRGEVASADRVILPGVGHASAAMERLRATGLGTLIPRLTAPVLGICLGMQLMCAHTEEGGVEGLGIFSETVRKFDAGNRIPHMGWNNICGLASPLFDGITEGERMYFVHSFYVPPNPHTVAACDYGGTFSAAMQRGNFYACQFHPEKSAAAGERILLNFINGCANSASTIKNDQ